MSRNDQAEKNVRSKPERAENIASDAGQRRAALLSVALGLASVVGTLVLGSLAYRYAIRSAERQCQRLYANKAKMLKAALVFHRDDSGEAIPYVIQATWKLSGIASRDESVIIIDQKGIVLFDQTFPKTIGQSTKKMLVLGKTNDWITSLSDLAEWAQDDAGGFRSYDGKAQVAAFEWVPDRQWLLGVYRSRAAIVEEARSDVFAFLLGFVAICGFLLPVSFLVLHRILRVSQRRRKQALEELQQSETRFRALAETAAAGIFIWKETRFQFVNPAMVAITGYLYEELINMNFWDVVHPDSQELVKDRGIARKHGEAVPGRYETRILTKSGDVRWIEISATAIELDGDQAVIGVAFDITKRKQNEERHLQSERLAAIGEMMTGLAHESRNALQRSQACLEMLRDEVDDRQTAKQLIDRLQNAQDHLHHLYEEVRRYAAPIKLNRACFNLRDIWQETWANLKVVYAHKNAELRDLTNGIDLTCHVDRYSIEQVFSNILENAITASPESTNIVVNCTETKINQHPALSIAIADDGPGLSLEQKTKIFEPFYTTKTRGTGLGMSIAKRIVAAHKGDIAVGDSRKAGTEIVVTLPRNGT